MSIRQFGEWRRYADLEPFDETRADLRAASIVQALAELLLPRKGRRKIRLEDCVLQFKPREPAAKRTPEQIRAEVTRTMTIMMAIQNRKKPQPEKRKRKRKR